MYTAITIADSIRRMKKKYVNARRMLVRKNPSSFPWGTKPRSKLRKKMGVKIPTIKLIRALETTSSFEVLG